VLLQGCGPDEPTGDSNATNANVGASNATNATEAANATNASVEPGLKELVIKEVKAGAGPGAKEGDLLLVQYKGTLKDGTVFDSNTAPDNTPYSLVIGEHQVIPGWEQGLTGMKVGGERLLQIPHSLAYGEAGRPPKIPPLADLTFTVKLLDMVPRGEENIYDHKDIKVGSGPAAKKGDTITMKYEGKLVNGKVFDSTARTGKPAAFKVGVGELVSGLDAGILGNGKDVMPMRKGGVRTLRIPPRLGYGDGTFGEIPGRSILLFRIELVDVKKP
jgi:peptidylprolyl isomerase